MSMSRRGAAAAVAVLAVGVAGCGSNKSYKNEPRPPAFITLTASISKDSVSVSPRHFGAGPVSLIITNQTDRAQQVTFASASGAGFSQATAKPINPSDTATLRADVPEGAAVVKVNAQGGADTIRPARLRVGPERPSAQNDLLLP
jgi:hypothetical protein